ncbi:MAG: N-6 DNA methylase [Desulfobaccales bacterium]
MRPLLEQAETARKEVGQQISQKRKAELGQFMTPATVARFMATLFLPSTLKTARVLDAGAGMGALSGAALDRFAAEDFPFQYVQVVAYEIDPKLRELLSETLAKYQGRFDIDISFRKGDFIEEAVKLIFQGEERFTHAILNPPYKKIHSASRHRFLLRRIGIETVNLYSAFVALIIELMQPGGQIVAIMPRSFCNGPYYRPFRKLTLAKTAIRYIHLFAARNRAFRDDDVLQENIIILLQRDAIQGNVTISTSTDDSFTDMETNVYPFDRIVFPDDPESFIHIPTSTERNRLETSPAIRFSLGDLGLEVSTGPVVDFRVKPHLRQMPEQGTVPLLYPGHFSGKGIDWPKPGIKKPNAILKNPETEKWLYPNGYYVVVRRFSSKEEKRRVMASVVCPDAFNGCPMLGFENHLNVFHSGKQGIAETFARGLVVFLNSTAVDERFRLFSGHTQVNATDLRLLKYPSREVLTHLGVWAKDQGELPQWKIDQKIESLA